MHPPVKAPPSPEMPMDFLEDRSAVVSLLSSSSRESNNINSSPRSNPLKKEMPKITSALEVINYLSMHPNSMPQYRYVGWNMMETVKTNFPFVYRINDGVSNNIILQEVCEERCWKEFKEPLKMSQRERDLNDSNGWNLWWSYNFYQGSPFRTLKCWQYTNHNPRAFQFCSKSYLTSFLRKMNNEYGEMYDFSPRSFVMPEDYIRFVTEHTRRQEQNCPDAHNVIVENDFHSENSSEDLENNNNQPFRVQLKSSRTKDNKTPIWILKPVGKSQGRGIFLTKDVGQMANVQRSVVQEYISRPLLIGGYKWDIRIYVCVTSTDPLVIYLYREGLCRFATEKFDLSNLSASFSHLTNASLNKLGPDYPTEKEVIGSGCKWSLKQLRAHFKKSDISDWYLWQKIMTMVVLTVVGEGLRSGYVYPSNRNCFDFFGFDILVDENLRPWLLEVNYSPGLGGDCEVDEIVKKPMLHELFDLLGFPDSSNFSSSSSTDSTIKVEAEFSNNNTNDCKRQHKYYQHNKNSISKTKKPEPVDLSCKGRLKQASSIYTQDLVYDFLENNSRNPNFRMTQGMKATLNKKRTDARKRRKDLAKSSTMHMEIDSEPNNSSVPDKYMETMPSADPTTIHSTGFNKHPASTPAPWFDQEFENSVGPYIYLQKQEWNNPPKNAGNWVLVYPCKAYPYKSPYRSSLADLRGIVKTVENYLQIAQFVFKTYPNQSDVFYRNKVKALCRWDIDLWIPPEKITHSDIDIVPFLL